MDFLNEQSKVVRIVIDGTPYLVYRDTSVEGMTREKGFEQVLRRLFLVNGSGTDIYSCIVFYLGLLPSFSWKSDEETLYGFKETLEFSFANLLPHLPLSINDLNKEFGRSRKCLAVEFGNEPDGFNKNKFAYSIQVKDGFFKTGQRIVFKNGVSRKQARREILQILLNAFDENPVTFMRIENLQSSIPLTTKEMLSNLYLLKEEDKVDFVTSPSDPQQIISVKIKAGGIRELEAVDEDTVKSPQMVKNVFGTNIENTTYGTNSPITVNIDEIETVFEALQREIKENPDIKNKKETLISVIELKDELTKGKNPTKVRQSLEKIQSSANWVYKKIISNPIVSGIIADLLMKAAGMK